MLHRTHHLRRLTVPLLIALVLTPLATAGAAEPARRPAAAAATSPGAGRSSAPVAPGAPLAPPSPDLPGLAAMSPELGAVEVDGASFRRASEAYRDVAADHATAQADRVGIDRAASDARAQARAAQARLAAARARASALQSRLDEIEAAIADLSIQLYVSGGSMARFDAALTQEQPSINDHDRRAVLGTASMDVLLAEQAAFRARLEEAQALSSAAADAVQAASSARSTATHSRAGAVRRESRYAASVASERVRYEEARALATVEGVDFTLVALDAYHRAAATIAEADPSCGLRWWGLAGIARVEGRHGTYGGAELDARGDATKRIIGIQLDGTRETAVVADSDGGTLDGDPVFDRAVGPMQFIPQTWSRFESDGNDDGSSTPFNMYDATLAAARYLCTASGALGADPGLRAAYFSYNHSPAYVDAVLSFARRYEASLEPLSPAS